MKIHREGFSIILISTILLSLVALGNYFLFRSLQWEWLFWLLNSGCLIFLVLVIQFFRVPKRAVNYTEGMVLCPADGKVVVIEEVEETEYFNDKRIQVSIFMSPLNVHANFNPISGIVRYVKYHAGLFLVAWHPKSSTDNERSTFVIQEPSTGQEILFRQIAGAVARRICYYVEEGQSVNAGDEFGFIKFGSRIDVFFPLGTDIHVSIGEIVKGKLTHLASLKK